MVGMMLHQDASPYAWLGGRPPLDLVVTMDDATSELYSAILVEEEGTISSFLGRIETIAGKGLFCSLYSDRGSHSFHTPEAGGKVCANTPTPVGRALAQLGIEHIPAYSPRHAGVRNAPSVPCRTGCPRSSGWPASPTMSMLPTATSARSICRLTTPASPSSRTSRARPSSRSSNEWRDILCIREERVVAADNTGAWKRRRL